MGVFELGDHPLMVFMMDVDVLSPTPTLTVPAPQLPSDAKIISPHRMVLP